jgi:hypothetical protein
MNFAHIIINVRNFYHKSRFLRKCYIFKYKTLDLFIIIRDRPFNLKGGGGGYGFLFRSELFFRTTQELEYLFFLSRQARIFFPEFNIRLYDKNWIILFFFSSTKIRIFFSATLGIRIFFLEKNHNPPPPPSS